MTVLDVGDTTRLWFEVRDPGGALVDAATVALTITLPDGSTVTPTVDPPAETGVYVHDYVVTVRGRHVVYWQATGPGCAYADVFNAADSSWPAIVGLTETKKHLGLAATDTSQDEKLRGFILSASAVVEDIVGVVAARPYVETHTGGERTVLLDERPVAAILTVAADGTPVDAGDYTMSPSGILARRSGRWPAGLRNITVTYRAGRTAVPANVLDATLELIRINWRPQQGGNYSAFDGGADDDFGTQSLGVAGVGGDIRLGFFVPHTVMQRLAPDRRGPVTA